MTGIPVVSIGPTWHAMWPYSPDLFEGHELAPLWSDRPSEARRHLGRLLADPGLAREVSEAQREQAIETFGKATIARQWQEFLG